MAPSHSRQLLMWSLPTIAVILSYLWYKKKRIGAKSDPGDTSNREGNEDNTEQVQEESEEPSTPVSTPNRTFSRSLSGVDSAPIDIIIPPELRSVKSTPKVISDEDLDLEIEKIKSMKSGIVLKFDSSPPLVKTSVKTPSPVKESTPMRPNLTPVQTNNNSNTKAKRNRKNRKSTNNMAQKDITVVEEKLSTLNLNHTKIEHDKQEEIKHEQEERKELQRQTSERDSANQSPDVMITSPSMSLISDNHSEGSNDSGKGASDLATPPPSQTPGLEESLTSEEEPVYLFEFLLPHNLVGKLIGRQGSTLETIKESSNTNVTIRKYHENNKLKLILIEGTQNEIDNALKLIRDHFPLKKYSEVTLEQVYVTTTPHSNVFTIIPDHIYLKLVEAVNNDTVVCCVVSANHLFLQQPTHPTFPNLNILSIAMNICYNDASSPLLPEPILENTICAANSMGEWYRAVVIASEPEEESCYCKFVDYGGYCYVPKTNLRQIRGDFLLLPFQAAECLLSNIIPAGDEGFTHEALLFVADITKGKSIYTQVIDYTIDGTPLVHCYVLNYNEVIFLNSALCEHGFALWVNSNGVYEEASTSNNALTENAVQQVVS